MKINISRQNIYILTLSFLLLIFVFVFSFAFLIPEGKKYRINKIELKKENLKLRKYQDYHDEVLDRLTELKSENRHIIEAFGTEFDPQRFKKIHKDYFNTLDIVQSKTVETMDEFVVYDVNTTSHINSPKSFYNFLDALNKSDWIIGVNFPINFERSDEMIKSSFSMKVYNSKAIFKY